MDTLASEARLAIDSYRALSSEARYAIEAFRRLPSVKVFETHEGSKGRCWIIAVAFAAWCRVHGVNQQIVQHHTPILALRRFLAPWQDQLLAEEKGYGVVQHANLIEDFVVDWAFPAWMPEWPWPLIHPLEDYAALWGARNLRICGHCGRVPNPRLLPALQGCAHPSLSYERRAARTTMLTGAFSFLDVMP